MLKNIGDIEEKDLRLSVGRTPNLWFSIETLAVVVHGYAQRPHSEREVAQVRNLVDSTSTNARMFGHDITKDGVDYLFSKEYESAGRGDETYAFTRTVRVSPHHLERFTENRLFGINARYELVDIFVEDEDSGDDLSWE